MRSLSADQFGQHRSRLNVPVGVGNRRQISPGFGGGGDRAGGGGSGCCSEFGNGGYGAFPDGRFIRNPRRRCRWFRESSPEPRMPQRLTRSHSERRIPLKTLFQEVKKQRIVTSF